MRVATGAGLYDHFLEQLAFHAGFDLVLEGAGDLETGDHHTAEDAALALGEALDARSATGAGSPATATPSCRWTTRSRAPRSTSAGARMPSSRSSTTPAWPRTCSASLAQAARAAIHVEATGRDAHHVAEAAFKAVGRALRKAVAAEGGRGCRRRRASL